MKQAGVVLEIGSREDYRSIAACNQAATAVMGARPPTASNGDTSGVSVQRLLPQTQGPWGQDEHSGWLAPGWSGPKGP